jgi:UDP-glucuronate 4-epimerase
VSFYAATKKANELMAHSYSHLFGIPTTGLRLFTVYGPWGRPDMALFSFTRAILAGKPIEIYGDGRMRRDFTYVDDVVEGIIRLVWKPAVARPQLERRKARPGVQLGPYRLYNIGNRSTVEVLRLIEVLEDAWERRPSSGSSPPRPARFRPPSPTPPTSSGTRATPTTPLEAGVGRFVEWYRDYYRV